MKRSMVLVFTVLLGLVCSLAFSACKGLGAGDAARQGARDGEVLPIPAPRFEGKIGRTFAESEQDYPQPVQAPAGAPNVVIILLDDLGFGHPSTFGGPIPTPHLDRLAEQGIVYNRFHTTAICSPTRAALLTGRNHHQCATGTITELSTGYPGYHSVWPRSCASVAEVLRGNGYNTAAWGKWHNTPDWETSPMGPFDRWPTGLGFEYWYGFQGGETSQFFPQLFRNTTPVEPPRTPEEGYHLTEDLTDDAIAWLQRQDSIAPDKPYFLYFATGATHAPLHAPDEWIERFDGQFDQGWDAVRAETLERQKALGVVPASTELTPRPEEIPGWDSLSPEAKRLYARHQEVFAGFMGHTDHHVGRLLDAIRALPDADNTLIFYVAGDNGPSAEGSLTGTTNNMMTQNGIPDTVDAQLGELDEIGGPAHENHYPVGWAWAGSSPFQWMKRVPSHFGGTRNGLVVSWPAHLEADGKVRSQFHHVIDVVPTIYEAVGVPAPARVNGVEQQPMAGTSMLYSFEDPDAPGTRTTQYFETGGHRAIYHDGWVAAARHGVPWVLTGSVDFAADQWELYNIDEDFSEAVDLASRYPEKLAALKEVFDEEAQKYGVFPLDDRFAERATNPARPSVTRGRSEFHYAPGTSRIPEGSAPPIYQRSHRVVCSAEVPAEGGDGVLVAEGGSSGGYVLYVKDRRLVYEYNFFGKERYVVAAPDPLPVGAVEVAFDYVQAPVDAAQRATGGTVRLTVNGEEVARGEVARVVPARFSATETLDIGMDLGSTVSKSYTAPYAYPHPIRGVTFYLR